MSYTQRVMYNKCGYSSTRHARYSYVRPLQWRNIFTFIHQKAGSNNGKAKKTNARKNQTQNIGTWCQEYTKCYKLALARYL